MNIDNVMTHISYPEDKRYLRERLYDVNIRLLKSSNGYRQLVSRAIDYMTDLLLTDIEGYTKLKGISGANLGVPWNIICVLDNTGQVLQMINPKYMHYNGEVRLVKSNCGSVRLKESIEVQRYKEVDVRWYNIMGHCYEKHFKGATAATLQHEIDHNLGVLITDNDIRYLVDGHEVLRRTE